jgi:hypothetical protein
MTAIIIAAPSIHSTFASSTMREIVFLENQKLILTDLVSCQLQMYLHLDDKMIDKRK